MHNNNRANYQNVPVERRQSSMTDLWTRYIASNDLEIPNNEQSVYGRGRNGSNREVPHHDVSPSALNHGRGRTDSNREVPHPYVQDSVSNHGRGRNGSNREVPHPYVSPNVANGRRSLPEVEMPVTEWTEWTNVNTHQTCDNNDRASIFKGPYESHRQGDNTKIIPENIDRQISTEIPQKAEIVETHRKYDNKTRAPINEGSLESHNQCDNTGNNHERIDSEFPKLQDKEIPYIESRNSPCNVTPVMRSSPCYQSRKAPCYKPGFASLLPDIHSDTTGYSGAPEAPCRRGNIPYIHSDPAVYSGAPDMQYLRGNSSEAPDALYHHGGTLYDHSGALYQAGTSPPPRHNNRPRGAKQHSDMGQCASLASKPLKEVLWQPPIWSCPQPRLLPPSPKLSRPSPPPPPPPASQPASCNMEVACCVEDAYLPHTDTALDKQVLHDSTIKTCTSVQTVNKKQEEAGRSRKQEEATGSNEKQEDRRQSSPDRSHQNPSSYTPEPKFNLKTFGSDDNFTIDEFVSVMDGYIRKFENRQPEEISSLVLSYLTGEAFSVVKGADAGSWKDMRSALLEHYHPDGENRAYIVALKIMRRKEGEAPSSLAVRIRACTRRAYPEGKLTEMDTLMIQTFLRAMDDKGLELIVLAYNMLEFKDVLDLATRFHLAEGYDPSRAINHKMSSVQKSDVEHSNDQQDEADITHISNIALSTGERISKSEEHTDRGRSRDSQERVDSRRHRDRSRGIRDRSYTRHDCSGRSRSNSGHRGSSRSYGHHDVDLRTRSGSGPKSDSRANPCSKCQGLGHSLLQCSSSHWYTKKWSIDIEKEQMEMYRQAKNKFHPKGQRTS